MLVLGRHVDEEVIIWGIDGEPIATVKVVSVKGDKVRIGFDFPKHIRVDRKEVYEAKQAAAQPRKD